METARDGSTRVVIAICTRNRPVGLDRLLRSIASAELPAGTEVLIVDNNDVPSVILRDSVQLAVPVLVVHEPRSGLPSVRNRALDEATQRGCRFVAFVDDDQTVDARWLMELLHMAERTEAQAVSGSTVRQFVHAAPRWAIESEAFATSESAPGAEIEYAGTGNLMLDLAFLRQHRLRFDERFPFLGGEDTKLTADIRLRGGRLVAAPESMAFEPLPSERVSFRWYLRRCYQYGHIAALRLERAGPPDSPGWSLRCVAQGVARIVAGVPLLPLILVRPARRHAYFGICRVGSGVGWIAAGLGVRYEPYRVTDGN